MDEVARTKQLQAALARDRDLAGDEPIKDQQAEKDFVMGCGAQPPKPRLQPVRRYEGLAQVEPTLIRGKPLDKARVLVEQPDDGPLQVITPNPKRTWLSVARA